MKSRKRVLGISLILVALVLFLTFTNFGFGLGVVVLIFGIISLINPNEDEIEMINYDKLKRVKGVKNGKK